MHGIPAPPRPAMDLLLAVAVGGFLIGAILILRGRTFGRYILALICGGVVAALAPRVVQIAALKDLNVWVVAVIIGLVAALLAYVLARLLWGLIVGSMLGITVVVILDWLNAPAVSAAPAWPEGPSDTFAAWAAAGGQYLWAWVETLQHENPFGTAVELAVPLILGLVLGLLRSNAATIIGACMLGAVAMVTAAGLAVWAFQPTWAANWVARIHVLAITAGLLVLIGLVVQGRAEIRKAREKQPPPGQPGRKPPG